MGVAEFALAPPQARRIPAIRYIVGPAYDWCFFLLPPLASLAVGVLISGTNFADGEIDFWGQSETLSCVMIGVVIHAHIFAVFFRSHANKNVFRKFPARFVLAPVLLYLAMVCSSWLLVSVAVLTTFWDVYHSGMQTFGFGRIYDARAGNDPSVGRRLDLVLNQLLYAGPIVAGATMLAHFNRFEYFEDVDSVFLPQIPGLMETHQHYFTWGLLILGSGYLVYYLFSYWRLWQRGYQISLAKVFLLTTTGFCSIYTWGFNSWGEAFLIMNLFHAIQYFGLVWSSEKTTLRRLAGVRNPRIAKPASIAMLLCVTGAYGYWVEAFDADIEWLWAVTLTVSIMHFWYDGFIWSVRRKEV